LDAAADDRAGVEPLTDEQAGGERRPRPARADRVDRPALVDPRRGRDAKRAVRHSDRAREGVLLALVLLAHVQDLDVAALPELGELGHGDGREPLRALAADEAELLEEADGSQQP